MCIAPINREKKKATRKEKRAARSVSIEGEDGEQQDEVEQSPGYAVNGAATANGPSGYQSNAAMYGAFPTEPTSHPQQQQATNDVYQAAYAQAYAHLQAQFQAAASQSASQYPAAQQSYGRTAQMPTFPAQPSFCLPTGPAVPPMQMPFPGMAGGAAPFPAAMPNAPGSDDGLANLLLSWYQSGYYTGRFQAMQEMKLRGHR
ncbi:hypothetical protein BBJ28_00005869 [Nothophytophthora sp. Chile5]|nr:hypothetical protein BBJ28_00005869 [Nothophytophthora sp. Chile5]